MSGWAAIGSAVGNIVGSVAAPIIQGEYNKDQAEDSRSWSEDMRKTAYQDTMADMEAAGLNPMLAYSQGPTATPSGASASISAPTGLGNIGSTALEAYKKDREIENLEKDWEVKEAQATREITQADLNHSQKVATDLANSAEKIRVDHLKKYPELIYSQIWADTIGKGGNAASSLLDVVPPFRRLNTIRGVSKNSAKSVKTIQKNLKK